MAIFWIGGIPQPYRVEAPSFQKGIKRVQRTAETNPVESGGDLLAPATEHKERVAPYDQNPPRQRRAVVDARQLMSRRIYTLGPDDPTSSAWHLFKLHRIHHVPIVDEDDILIGIVSEHDLLAAAVTEQEQGPLLLGQIMTRRVLATGPDTPIREIAGTMAREQIHAIPVINASGRLEGLVTAGDILGCLVNRAPLDLWI